MSSRSLVKELLINPIVLVKRIDIHLIPMNRPFEIVSFTESVLLNDDDKVTMLKTNTNSIIIFNFTSLDALILSTLQLVLY